MDLDRINWNVYPPEKTGKALTNPRFYLCMMFAALLLFSLASCSTPPNTTDDRAHYHEPGFIRR